MSETQSRPLTTAALRALSVPSNAQGAARLSVHLLLIGAGVALVAAAGPWTLLLAMLFLGVMLAALFAPVHETMHRTAFASRRACAVVGWLAACPSLLNWHFYAEFHVAHHRFTQDPDRDPELAAPPPATWAAYALRVTGLPYWRGRLAVLADAWRGDMSAYPFIASESAAARVIASVRWMTVFVLGCVAPSVWLFGWQAPLLFWLGPMLLGQPLLRLYLLTEHTLCSLDSNGLTNTRTTLTNALVRLLMWNMSFHAEHHLYPGIPFHRLPAAHAAIGARLAVVQPGYARWHGAFLRRLRA